MEHQTGARDSDEHQADMSAQRADRRFTELYGDHHVAIRGYCQRRLDRTDVDDAVSEVFGVVWRRIDEVPGGESALYWIYGVARNVVRNLQRGAARRRRLRLRARTVREPAADTPDLQVVRSESISAVLHALASLRSDDQEILRLRTWEELSRREIAAVYGISVEAVSMRLSRAGKRMARAMERQGIADEWRRSGSEES